MLPSPEFMSNFVYRKIENCLTYVYRTGTSGADPGSGAFLTPESGIGKKNRDPDPG
jgi:hypothetical protein